MKGQILENALVITSALKLETIKKLEKIAPNALVLTECKSVNNQDEITEIFKIASGKKCELSNYGIVFANKNKAGYATCTIALETGAEDIKALVVDKYAAAFIKLNALEAVVNNAAKQIEDDYKTIADSIVVL